MTHQLSHLDFETERAKKVELFPHCLSADNLVILKLTNEGWSRSPALAPPVPNHYLTYAYIIAETQDHLDVQLIFPHQLTLGSGPTDPSRFFRLMKESQIIKYFPWKCQILEKSLSEAEPKSGSVKTSWSSLGVFRYEECCVCMEAMSNRLTRCGHQFCVKCCLGMVACPLCLKKLVIHNPEPKTTLDSIGERLRAETSAIETLVARLRLMERLLGL